MKFNSGLREVDGEQSVQGAKSSQIRLNIMYINTCAQGQGTAMSMRKSHQQTGGVVSVEDYYIYQLFSSHIVVDSRCEYGTDAQLVCDEDLIPKC
eukprot:1865116-Pyramimonas_sp.AAC.1